MHYVIYSLGAPGFAWAILQILDILPFDLVGLIGSDDALRVYTLVLSTLGACLLILETLWAVRRCYDFNAHGWLAIIAFVPVLNVVLWLAPGSLGKNRYGPAPSGAPRWLILTGLLPIVPGVVMIVAL